jgi:hypothetical protein
MGEKVGFKKLGECVEGCEDDVNSLCEQATVDWGIKFVNPDKEVETASLHKSEKGGS